MRFKFLALLLCLALALNFAVSAGAEEQGVIRLGVMKFLARAQGVSDQQAEAVGDIFARMLTNSRYISVLERDRLDEIANEQKLGSVGAVDAASAVTIGKIAGCQYMLLGSVTNLSKKGESMNLWLWGTKSEQASATIDVRVVNVETSEVILSLSETGTAAQSGKNFNFYGMTKDEAELIGMEAGAINAATCRLGFKVREVLTGEYAQVLDSDGKDITLNVGATSGIINGSLYRIYTDGAEIRDTSGKSLGRKVNNIAVVKVVDAQNDFSIANIAKIDKKECGSAKFILRGDKVSPIYANEAKDLIARKAFPKSRPVMKDNAMSSQEIDDKFQQLQDSRKNKTQGKKQKTWIK